MNDLDTTPMERAALAGILASDYQDDVEPIGVAVWTWDVWSSGDAAEITPASRGGVVASLSKKGLVTIQDARGDDDETIAITTKGLAALRD